MLVMLKNRPVNCLLVERANWPAELTARARNLVVIGPAEGD